LRDSEKGFGGVSGWSLRLYPADMYSSPWIPDGNLLWKLGFSLTHDQIWGWQLYLPFWFLVTLSGSLAMICQLRWPWRFTLRHLFIATTFLAVVLGMIACLDRSWIGK
jgi:hypothetical protein